MCDFFTLTIPAHEERTVMHAMHLRDIIIAILFEHRNVIW